MMASQEQLIGHIKASTYSLPSELSLNARKIARGENYRGLPYWVCDFPAHMGREHIWAFRLVVWWGNHISFNLILKGRFKKAIHLNVETVRSNDLYFTLVETPWAIEFDPEVQKIASSLSLEEILSHFEQHDFIKLSCKFKLEEINLLPSLSVTCFDRLTEALS